MTKSQKKSLLSFVNMLVNFLIYNVSSFIMLHKKIFNPAGIALIAFHFNMNSIKKKIMPAFPKLARLVDLKNATPFLKYCGTKASYSK